MDKFIGSGRFLQPNPRGNEKNVEASWDKCMLLFANSSRFPPKCEGTDHWPWASLRRRRRHGTGRVRRALGARFGGT